MYEENNTKTIYINKYMNKHYYTTCNNTIYNNYVVKFSITEHIGAQMTTDNYCLPYELFGFLYQYI